MKHRKRRHNPKRSIAQRVAIDRLKRVSAAMSYGGNPEHKRNPGDFGLTPPVQPRPDKTLCDDVHIFERAVALEHLRRGVERGLVSESWTGDWPQNIWARTTDGRILEAQLENAQLGSYHAYPLPESDPFVSEVQKRWEQARVR